MASYDLHSYIGFFIAGRYQGSYGMVTVVLGVTIIYDPTAGSEGVPSISPVKTVPTKEWTLEDELSLRVEENGDVRIINETRNEEMYGGNIYNPTVIFEQDTFLASGGYTPFNFELLNLGDFNFSNEINMVKSIKLDNFIYMLDNITMLDDNNTYLALIRYDIDDGKTHVFHLGRDFFDNLNSFDAISMHYPDNIFYIFKHGGEHYLIIESPIDIQDPFGKGKFFLFKLTGTQIFYLDIVTSDNTNGNCLFFNNQLIFEDGFGVGIFDGAKLHASTVTNDKILYGMGDKLLTYDDSLIYINSFDLQKKLYTGEGSVMIPFSDVMDRPFSIESYVYNKKLFLIGYFAHDYNSTIELEDFVEKELIGDDSDITCGGLSYRAFTTGGPYPKYAVNYGFCGIGDKSAFIYIPYIHSLERVYNVDAKIDLDSKFHNALFCSYGGLSWAVEFVRWIDFIFYILDKNYQLYTVYVSAEYIYSYDLYFLYDEPQYILHDISIPHNFNLFGGVLYSTSYSYNISLANIPVVFTVNSAGYPQFVNLEDPTEFIVFDDIVDLKNPLYICEYPEMFGVYGLLTGDMYPAIFVVNQSGEILAYGDNYYGQLGLGDGSSDFVTTWTKLDSSFNNPTAIYVFGTCTYFVYGNGDIYCAGYNYENVFNLADSSLSNEFITTPMKSQYNYNDFINIMFGNIRTVAINKVGETVYSGIEY